MSNHYDVVVIGSGAAAQTVVYDLKKQGKSVAIIEKNEWGGTCALRGCVPKKVLVGAAEVNNRAIDAQDNGISFNSLRIDWSDLIKFKKSFTDSKSQQFKQSFVDAGIDTYKGTAHFTGKKSIKVNENELTAENFVIATGAKPRKLGIPGEKQVITSDQFLSIETLPKSIVFIGGGLISFEFAHVAARAGAKVTILHRSKQPLNQFDSDLVDLLIESSKDIGIDVQVNKPVKQVEKKNEAFIVKTDENGSFETDLVVHGAGRVPDIDDLDLKKANINFNKRGIEVNSYLQNATNPYVYAAGDVAFSNLPLTPVAGAEGKNVLMNLLHDKKKDSSLSVIPSAVFTVPPLAMVGLTEDQAKQKGVSYTVNYQDTSSWFTSRRIGLSHSGFKILIDKENKRIIGAHLFGHHAEEVINLFAVFIKKKMTIEEIKELVWCYPTSTYDINYML
ncbi:MAG: NAD(P)/FAD-dependent oxidoreductase [Candidatus Thermoplasmatota archaeon]|nr:NAD(P)/FAD-dependent oxidoreductase [Candidatus Thermoplasmatota archaeon]